MKIVRNYKSYCTVWIAWVLKTNTKQQYLRIYIFNKQIEDRLERHTINTLWITVEEVKGCDQREKNKRKFNKIGNFPERV